VFPLCSDRKVVVNERRLKPHIIFEGKVPGALKEVWRIIFCHSLLILELEEWLLSGTTQQFHGLDVVGTHVTDIGNNVQSTILACTKNFTKRSALVLPMYEVVSNWLLSLWMQTTDHEM
jgi:hypothetical protein